MRPPRYAARNVELFHFDRVSAGLGGVFADEDGRVQAILASFSYARAVIMGHIDQLVRNGQELENSVIDAYFSKK